MPLTETQLAIDNVPSVAPNITESTNRSSTSILLKWTSVPTESLHGVPLKGYTVFYRKAGSIYHPDRLISVQNQNDLLVKGLEKFTLYYLRVLAFTGKGNGLPSKEVNTSTDEDVPSSPPPDFNARVVSSTVIEVMWQPINHSDIHGILLGYNVSFNTNFFGELLVGFKILSSDTRSVMLTELKKFTYYAISVCGFTSKGCGAPTIPQRVQTLEDVPSLPPSNVHATTLISASSINLSWNQIQAQFINGVLLGYIVEMQLVSDAGRDVPNNIQILKIGPDELSVVLQQLSSFSLFKFRVAARTRLGVGAFSKEIYAETCRCPPVLYTNWWVHPPYLNKTKFRQPEGIFPPIVKSMVTWACGDCVNGHGKTMIDFSSDGKSNKAEKSSNFEVLQDINEEVLSFPLYGGQYVSTYLGIHTYIPLVISPGVAFITVDDDPADIPLYMWKAILDCFPFVVLTVMMAYLAGIIVWILERKSNPDHFPESFCKGAYEGLWWSFISMTTVGYGDRSPTSIPGRLFAIVWTLTGLVVIGILTGSISTALTSYSFNSAGTNLYGTKIATLENSSEQRIGIMKNAKVNTERKYLTLEEINQDLANRKIKGTLVDSYVAAEYKQMFLSNNIRVNKILRKPHAYGIVLSGEMMKLQHLFYDYLHVHAASISKQIASKTSALKKSTKSESEEKATGLFDHNSTLFRTAFYSSVVMLVLAVTAGLVRESISITKKRVLPCKRDKLFFAKQLKSDLKNVHEEFLTGLKDKWKQYKEEMKMLLLQHQKQLSEKKKEGV